MAGYWRTLLLSGGLLCLLLSALGQTGQVSQAASQNNPAAHGFVLPQTHRSGLTPAEQKGQALYGYYCTICHGVTGQGGGFNSYNLAVPPAKHADPARMAARSDTQIQEIIKEGGAVLGMSPLMPAWGGVLTGREASDVTAFIRTLAKQDGGKK
jgi:mono/diheme cytochrome c family protein